MRALALLRVLAGPVVLLHLRPFLVRRARRAHLLATPSTSPTPPGIRSCRGDVYVGLLWLGAVAAVCMTLGLLTRLATATTFAIVAYNLFLVDHALPQQPGLPGDRARPAGAWRRAGASCRSTRGCAGAAGFRRSTSTRARLAAVAAAVRVRRRLRGVRLEQAARPRLVRRHRHVAARGTARRTSWARLPDWACPSLTDRGFHTGAAKFIVLTELFIALGLWWRGTRYAAVWVAVVFHLVDPGARRRCRSSRCLAIAVLVVWAVPSTRDRVLRFDPSVARERRLAAAVRALDWLARFRVEPGSRLEAVDRDGTGVRRHAGRGVRPQPAAADRLVRAARAAPARGPPGPPRGPAPARRWRPGDMSRVWRAGLRPGAARSSSSFGVGCAARALPAR